MTISDASCCQEQDQLDGNTRNVKSQQACITALAPGNTVNAEKFELEFDENQKSLSQYMDGRSLGTVQCCRTWIANLSHHRRHERTAQDSSVGGNGFRSNETFLVQFTDSESLFAHSVSPSAKHLDNKRLAIDLSALKKLIWDNRDDCDEECDGSKCEYLRWIDTSAMLSDGLTKTLTSCRLIETLSTGNFDMRPTEESLAIKAKNRKWRASRKEQERSQDPDTWYYSRS